MERKNTRECKTAFLLLVFHDSFFITLFTSSADCCCSRAHHSFFWVLKIALQTRWKKESTINNVSSLFDLCISLTIVCWVLTYRSALRRECAPLSILPRMKLALTMCTIIQSLVPLITQFFGHGHKNRAYIIIINFLCRLDYIETTKKSLFLFTQMIGCCYCTKWLVECLVNFFSLCSCSASSKISCFMMQPTWCLHIFFREFHLYRARHKLDECECRCSQVQSCFCRSAMH